MSHAIQALAVKAPKETLEPFEYVPEPLGLDQIEVKITHCGISHADLHLIDNEWGISSYPLVPGHEIIGIISQVGENVSHLKEGQRVGIGWQRSSCGFCEWCVSGDVNLCAKLEPTCINHYGGFAKAIRSSSKLAFEIPEEIASPLAAPLLCSGATVYAPFHNLGIGAEYSVGVVGIGGLGHLAVQFAKALGCKVFAFSSTPEKMEEISEFGADQVISSVDAVEMRHMKNTLDFILVTVTASLDWNTFIDLLKPKGILCFVGSVPTPVAISVKSLINGQKNICGSISASTPVMKKMLELAAAKKITPQVEQFKFFDANRAIELLRTNQIRYRAVLTME